MNIRKYLEKRQRKQIALHVNYTIAEAPLVDRWINGDDSAEDELQSSWRKRARDGAAF